jgi:hypothetical protein
VEWAEDRANESAGFERPPVSDGYLYASLFSLACLMVPSVEPHTLFAGLRTGVAMSSAASMAVFEHALRLPVSTAVRGSAGSLATLIANDTRRLIDGCFYFIFTLGAPIEIAVSLAFIYQEVNCGGARARARVWY